MGILLNTDINWIAIKIFETVTEINRVVISSVSFLKECKQFLELMKKIVIVLSIVMGLEVEFLLVVNSKHKISECWVHVELLKHSKHVADSSKIP